MKKTILAIVLATLGIEPVLHAEETKYPPINPALLYWQAASELPHLTPDQAKEVGGVASGTRPFDAAKLRDLPLSDANLRLLKKAATSTAPCDWGIVVEDGPMASLPHLAKIRELANLAMVKAEMLFAEGNVPDGKEWLLIAHRMARHAGAGDFLVLNLLQNAIEANGIRAAARHCLGWDETTRHAYAEALKALPPLHTVQDALHGERFLIQWVERQMEARDGQHNIGQLMQALATGEVLDHDQLVGQIQPKEMRATLAEWRSLQSRVEATLKKSWPESQPSIKALTEEGRHSTHFLVRSALPLSTGVLDRWYELGTLRTMLEAALEHGAQLDEKTAATYRDSLEGEPLRFTKTADSAFTLAAAHPHPAGKELVLKFGR